MSERTHAGAEPWMEQAKCLTIDVATADSLFYPTDSNNSFPAKRFCNGTRNQHGAVIDQPCPVRAECLEKALRDEDWWGVWGGKSSLERRAEARKRAKAAG